MRVQRQPNCPYVNGRHPLSLCCAVVFVVSGRHFDNFTKRDGYKKMQHTLGYVAIVLLSMQILKPLRYSTFQLSCFFFGGGAMSPF
uniref:Uncharacterized protein n=1 Tax=Anguilla anguilla TaxID=7936 RepID=A0A0E9X3I2_ANGAN